MTREGNVNRRQAIALAATGIAGLAGCGRTDHGEAPSRSTDSSTARTSGSPSGTAGSTGTAGTAEPSASSSSADAVPTRAVIVERYRSSPPKTWGLTTPGVHERLATGRAVVALTFDACGGPTPRSAGCGYDHDLIELLRRHQAKATLFLNQRWIAANPGPSHELMADPLFEIGNHGTRHLPLSVTGRSAYGERGTANPGEVYDEIVGNRDNLTTLTGRVPHWFRPGTAFCDDVAVRIAADLGCHIAGFSVNGDAGTTFTRAEIVAALATAKTGDIVISHMNRPEHQTAEGYRDALPRLLDRGLRTVTLSEVTT